MNQGERILLIAGIILIDLLVFAIPVTAFFAAYVIWARPVWFRQWVQDLYDSE